MEYILNSGVARGVAGVAEATPIFQFLFSRFGQKISVKKNLTYCRLHQSQKPTYLPDLDNSTESSLYIIHGR